MSQRPLLRWIALLLCYCLWGCASVPPMEVKSWTSATVLPDPNPQLYHLYIDSTGDLIDPSSRLRISNPNKDKSVEEDLGEQVYIDNMIRHFERYREDRNGKLDLVVYVHGGLNTFENATGPEKEQIRRDMLADGKYPIFISWNSAFPGNYSDHLFLLRRGIKERFLGPLSSPFVLAEDMLRSIARLPASIYNVVFGQNTVLLGIKTEEEDAATRSLKHLEALEQFKLTGAESNRVGGFPLADRATLFNPIKLVTAPFVDGFGKGTWNSMLRRTDLVLLKQIGFDGDTRPKTAASKFFEAWLDKQKQKRNGQALPITIIGHSMGAIIANNIISSHPDVHFDNIVYMAAACRTKDLQHMVAPYMHRQARFGRKPRFFNLSLNSERDIMERTAFDSVPRGSLLVWIDQVLADVNSFQDRTAGFWFNMVRSADKIFDPELRPQVHLTQFGIGDDTPQNHGDFDAFPFWRETFWWTPRQAEPQQSAL